MHYILNNMYVQGVYVSLDMYISEFLSEIAAILTISSDMYSIHICHVHCFHIDAPKLLSVSGRHSYTHLAINVLAYNHTITLAYTNVNWHLPFYGG